MKNFSVSKAFAVFFALFMGFACEEQISVDAVKVSQMDNVAAEYGKIELGEKTEDPHLMRHMEKALKELSKTDERFKTISLKPNYKYVKLTPTNENGVADVSFYSKDLDVYNFPLDYKIKKYGNTYDDPEENSRFQSYWLVAPIEFKFSQNLKEKIIEEAFFPFGNGQDDLKQEAELEPLYAAIEKKSNQNLYPKSKNAKINVTYSGSIAIEEDTISDIIHGVNSTTKFYLPLKGITVRARNLLTTNSTSTNAQGNFLFTRNWLNNVDEYTICWESSDFYLENLWGDPARSSFSGASISNNWHFKIKKQNHPWEFRYGHVYRGAYHYYNLASNDITLPPKASIIQAICNQRSQVAIRVRDGNQSTTRGINSVGCFSNVVIENTLPTPSQPNPNFKGYYIFASIAHELTHLKHWAMTGGMTDLKYCSSASKGGLAESYALMGEYYMVNKEYSSLIPIPLIWMNNGNNFDRGGYQKLTVSHWNNKSSNCFNNIGRYYTPYFIDLIDTRNQYLSDQLTPNDQVSGYTAKFLEDCLKASPDNWPAVNSKIKNPGLYGPILQTPTTAQGNSAANIDYLYNLYSL